MELELSTDQTLLRDTVARFLATLVPTSVVRDLQSVPAGYAPGYWRTAAAMGWTSLLVPESLGGGSPSDHGLLDLVIVAEEMGRGVAPGPLAPVNLVAHALAEEGTTEQQEEVLPGLLTGEVVAAWTGPTPVSGERSKDGYVLTGTARLVEAGAQASILLVVVAAAQGPTHLLVPADLPGVTVKALEGLDFVRRYADLQFDAVVVPATAIVGEDGGAGKSVEQLLQIACLLQCAETVGCLDHVFEMTIGYLNDRYSFGRPLASYQALKHRLADNKLWLESCHGIATAASRAVAARADGAGELVSAAKAWIGPHATELIQDCIQLHGGIAVTWEHDLHLYLRRATVNRVTYGTADWHADRVAAARLETAA